MDAIRFAYANLADRYHPRAGLEPNQEKYDAVTLAFEILSDPELRKDFDKLKGIGGEEKPRFSGPSFFEAYGRDTLLRVTLLCVLYDRRRTKPFTPSLSMRHIEAMVAATSEELNFALWYLKVRDMVAQDDKSSLQITPDGMDFLQAHPPQPESVLVMIRSGSMAGAVEEEEAPQGGLEGEETAVEEEQVSVEAAPISAASESINKTVARIGSLLAKRNLN